MTDNNGNKGCQGKSTEENERFEILQKYGRKEEITDQDKRNHTKPKINKISDTQFHRTETNYHRIRNSCLP